MSADGTSYLDSSALVKLIVNEAQTEALVAHLSRRSRSSCALALVEVVRAVRGKGAEATAAARRVMTGVELLALDDTLLRDAADLGDAELRSLDAIHVAAARTLGTDLAELITYDRRMAGAARALGLPVLAPA
jgi:predicted nucleic acid-binding protein